MSLRRVGSGLLAVALSPLSAHAQATRPIGSFWVADAQVYALAEANGVVYAGQEVCENVDQGGGQHRRRQAQHARRGERAEAGLEAGDRPALGEDEGGSARHAHHPERGDEWRQPAARDEQAVHQAARRARRAADSDRERSGERRRQCPPGPPGCGLTREPPSYYLRSSRHQGA